MFNETANTQTLNAFENGLPFAILVVRCLKTGGRWISVRSVTPAAFAVMLRAGSRDRNFGAYNSPILSSIRKYGVDGHIISFHSAYKTRKEANLVKKELVEKQAISNPEKNLNWNRPKKNMPTNDFYWKSEEEVAQMAKAKRIRARTAKAIAATTTTETAMSV
jgi:hypothetical protein